MDIKQKMKNHLSGLAPHIAERAAAKILSEALAEIERLEDMVSVVARHKFDAESECKRLGDQLVHSNRQIIDLISETNLLRSQAQQHAGVYADELEKLAVEIETLRQGAVNVHDAILRGEDDKTLLGMLTELYSNGQG